VEQAVAVQGAFYAGCVFFGVRIGEGIPNGTARAWAVGLFPWCVAVSAVAMTLRCPKCGESVWRFRMR